MTCEDVRNLLDEYVDGELPAPERKAVEAHLAACPACEAEHLALQKVVGLVRDLPQLTAPASIAERIEAAMQNEPARQRPVFARWIPVGAFVAAAAALILSIHIGMMKNNALKHEGFAVSQTPHSVLRQVAPSGVTPNETPAPAAPGEKANDDLALNRNKPGEKPSPEPPAGKEAGGGSRFEKGKAPGPDTFKAEGVAAKIGQPTPRPQEYVISTADVKPLEAKVAALGGKLLSGQQARDYAGARMTQDKLADAKQRDAGPDVVVILPRAKAAELVAFVKTPAGRPIVAAKAPGEPLKDDRVMIKKSVTAPGSVVAEGALDQASSPPAATQPDAESQAQQAAPETEIIFFRIRVPETTTPALHPNK